MEAVEKDIELLTKIDIVQIWTEYFLCWILYCFLTLWKVENVKYNWWKVIWFMGSGQNAMNKSVAM